ncbi:SLIT and NTRK-like protein 5 [Paramormyrops kingsleyae]|uniref:SLIT and NTRK like family member 5 n=1 Tax=Paramormyrops kingsleyae TaxID=1676925 RepID=A0A3B3RFK3_9TELE|nr:SLIT and NTRK-like protein 5 [Paramormyrops kingsleyae]XP_023666305.1 SLIT and NTRK-like protein 5 [Paramormyrops kingsleyae]XP_023666306.1 SLIT and NTRK-like protein 5 [Paramormyrops kingsleyae]XP_023666307.1 SLIT and NTRK-like protein 5 [Paramormyrops kingsleyae]
MPIWIWKFTLLVTTSLSFVEMYDGYGEICRNLCTCEEKDGILTVSCENRGIVRLSEISPVRFPMYHLLLTGNLLKRLSPNDFINYTAVTILHLGNNDISEVETGAFNGLQGLRRLHLNNNKIDALRDDTFVGLERLEYLQIDYNYITHIEPNAFGKLHHLEVLILNDNLLSALPTNIFRHVPLTHLDLRGNRLKMFPYVGLLEHMDKVVELQLEENPWNCSCELITLKAWLESISYTALVGEVVCETPFRLHGRDLDEVSKQELCPRRAISEYEMRPQPPLSTIGYFQTMPAVVTVSATSSAVLRSSSRPTKGTGQLSRSKTKPTSRIPSNIPYNYGPIIAYQTKSPVPLDCPAACTCNLQISDLGLNVNCQERKIENISDLKPKPYNPKKMYLTGNYISVVRRSDFIEATGLDLLHLGNNRIAIIHDRAFGDLAHLRRLYLNGNLIERLTIDMFYGLQSLQYLYLEYNVIREIVSGTFQYLPNLQLLFLNNNVLKTLPGGVFSGLTLARLNLCSNHFQNLPVNGVLDHLKSLVQIDLHENPWDCSCDVVGMKMWLELLNAGTVVNGVLCETPKKLTGQDVRSVSSDQLCTDYSDVIVSTLSPTEESLSESPTTIESSLRYTPSSTVPLSVLILSLLLVFIMSVFVAAGLFVVVMKRRKKSQNERTSTNNSDVSSFNLHYSLYSNRSVPKVKPPAGHVYEYIPHSLGHMCKNPIYRSREGNAVEDYRDLHELKVSYRNNTDEERDSGLRSPTYSVSTIEPRDDPSPVQDAEHFFRAILEPDKQSPSGHSYEYKYSGPASYTYTPNYDVRRQFLHPERIRETVLYSTTPSTIYIEPTRNEYLELKAKLQVEPDYLEVLEKQTTFSQF